MEKFESPVNTTTIPILIIEFSNDPLVETALLEKTARPFPNCEGGDGRQRALFLHGHSNFYAQQLRDFLENKTP